MNKRIVLVYLYQVREFGVKWTEVLAGEPEAWFSINKCLTL